MELAEFERRITDAREALDYAARYIKDNDAFEVEGWVIQAFKDLEGCKAFAVRWAEQQENEIAKAKVAREWEKSK